MTILYSLPPLVTALFLALLAAVTLVGNRKQAGRFAFFWLCLLGCLLNVDIMLQLSAPSEQVALQRSRWLHLFHPFLLPLFIQFFHDYLNIRSRRWLTAVAYGWAGVLAACSQGDWVLAGMERFAFGYAGQGGRLYPMMALGAVLATCYNLVILARAIGSEKRSVRKNQLKYVFTGFGGLSLLTCLNVLVRFGFPVYPPGNFGFIPLAIFAAGIFRYDLLDMGLLIRKGLVYSVLTALLTLVYASIITVAQSVITASRIAETMLVPVILVAVVALVFGPLKSRVQKRIDHLFDKGRMDYRHTIKRASRTIASALDYPKIIRLLDDTIISALRVSHCALYLKNDNRHRFDRYACLGNGPGPDGPSSIDQDSDLVRRLMGADAPLVRQQWLANHENKWREDLLGAMASIDAEVVLPLSSKDRLMGLMVLGEKRSGELYARQELDLLETLGHQSAVAVENVHAYAALKKLNQTLESRVVSRTQALEKALREKERTQEQLVRSESLASLGQLVAGVAHELNNPLASVTSLLQSTIEDLQAMAPGEPIDAELIDDLFFADRELSRAKAIVSSLLGLARQGQTYAEPVDLSVVVQDALRLLENRYRDHQLQFDVQFEPDLPVIHGNFANLGQVVINIIHNAVQAVDASNGKIDLGTWFERETRHVVFACRDNGPGIDDQIQKDVFKPFFTTKPSGNGTGLGLYICHEIVCKHGGSIDLQPAEPHGTLAMVRLPVDKGRSGNANPMEKTAR